VVSVKPDFSAQSAVQAATGQPLLANSTQQVIYNMFPHGIMPPQPTYQMGQVCSPHL